VALDDARIEDIRKRFQSLSSASVTLNHASASLSMAISQLDAALKKLNLGLTVWTIYHDHGLEPPYYDVEELGYAKVAGTWGLAVRRRAGSEEEGVEETVTGPTLLNDAAREVRLIAADYIPNLIDALLISAASMANSISTTAVKVHALAAAFGAVPTIGAGGAK
jgi:hypothetical protein